jgi:hypothetical protein
LTEKKSPSPAKAAPGFLPAGGEKGILGHVPFFQPQKRFLIADLGQHMERSNSFGKGCG